MLACIRCGKEPIIDETISMLCTNCQRKKDGLDPEYNAAELRRWALHNRIMKKHSKRS